tara:strand:- start:4710 stop:5282 length:573 start_codon:yes stop_codon:yes gene_type:complete
MTNKKNQKWIGPLGEILALVGALFFAAFEGWPSVSGLILAVAVVVAAIVRHDSEEYLASSIRKALSLAPGVAVEMGWMHPEKAVSVVGLIPPVFAIYWSWRANGGGAIPPKLPCVALLACLAISLLPSCGGYVVFRPNELGSAGELRELTSGVVIRERPDGGAKAVIDSQTVKRWFEWGGVVLVDQESGK